MEGNECYKFSTISNYITHTGEQPVDVVIEVGVHVGAVTRLIRSAFPKAKIHGFEAVTEYFDQAKAATRGDRGIRLYNKAVTSQHLFADDLGAQRRSKRAQLKILKATPAAGPGWSGGSTVVASDHPILGRPELPPGFELIDQAVRPVTLDEIVASILKAGRANTIDLLKLDCEGCEHSTLGCAKKDTLERIRFIVGEYHGIDRFYAVMRNKLFRTHKVNLIGDKLLGCFFAERLSETADGVLKHDNSGMLQPRPWLSATAIEWHLFDERHVLPSERAAHALPPA
jgi:FkbM family methyltransferase